MNALLVSIPLLILLLGGWGIAALLLPGECSFAARLANAWLLGALAVSLLLAVLGGIFSGPVLMGAVTLALLIPACLALRKPFPRPRLEGPGKWIACAVILCQLLFLARFVGSTAIAWDGLVVWEVKARIAMTNGGCIPIEYFSDPTRAWSHPDYPLMLPMLETWIYLWLGKADQSLARVIFPCFYLAALLLIYTSVADVARKRWWGLCVAAALFFIPFFTDGQSNVFTGYADFPLAVLYLAAVDSLLRYFRKPEPSRLLIFSIYAGALPWMKREGLILWLCLMLVAGVEFLRRSEYRRALLAATPGLVLIVGWKLALFAVRALPNTDFMPVTASNVRDHLGRIPVIAQYSAGELTSIKDWSLLWPLFVMAIAVLAARGKRALSLRLCTLVAIPALIYSGIYMLSTWQPFETHMDCSLARLYSQLALVALVTVGFAAQA
jgi:hypothetical protein